MAGQSVIVSVLADTKNFRKNMSSAGDVMSSAGKKITRGAAVVAGGMALLAKKAGDSASDQEQAFGGLEAVFGKNIRGITKWRKKAATEFGLSKTDFSTFSTLIGSQLKNAGVPMDQLAGKTKTVLQQASDFAATYGGTTADAVDAISAALKGEYDPIEKYGVTLTATSLAQYELANGMDTSTAKAKSLSDKTAVLQLLQKQGADAAGQWKKQLGTAAEQQQVLAAKTDDASAKLGKVLLPVMVKGAKILARFADWASENSELVQRLAVVITGLAGAILLTSGTAKTVGAVSSAFNGVKVVAGAAAPVLGRFRDGFSSSAAAASAFSGKAGTLGGVTRKALGGVQALGRGALTLVTTIGQGTLALGRQAVAWTVNTARMVAAKTAQLAISVATKAAAAAQWLLNAAMSANPIGLIIAGIALLVAGLVWFFTQTKLGQAIVRVVWAKIQQAIEAVVKWFQNTALPFVRRTWAGITGAFTSARDRVVGVLHRIWSVIKQVWQYSPLGLIVNNWGRIMSWLGGIPGKVGAIFRNAIAWLVGAGRNVLVGLRNGLVNGWSIARSWIGGIPGAVASMLGNAGSWLYNAGRNVVQGFVNGLASLWNNVQQWFTKLTNKIPSWKGPVKRDKTLLTGAGRLIMGGLVKGLQKGSGQVRSTLGGVTEMIRDGIGGADSAFAVGGVNVRSAPRTQFVSVTVQAGMLHPTPQAGRVIADSLDEWHRKNGDR